MPRGSNSHAFSTRSDDRPGSSKRLVSVVVDPKTGVSEKKTSGKDGKTGTSGKKSACPASDAPHSPQVLCAKPSHVSCAKSGSALHTEPFHADGESAVTCAKTDSVSQHNSSVSAQKICAVRNTETEERVVRKTHDLDIIPSVSQERPNQAGYVSRESRSRSRKLRNRHDSSSDTSPKHVKKRRRRSRSNSRLETLLSTVLGRIHALENASNSGSNLQNLRPQPPSPKPPTSRRAHDISPSPERDIPDEFVYPDSHPDEYNDGGDHSAEKPCDDNSGDSDIVDLLLEGKEAEKRGPPLEKTAICIAKTFFDDEFPSEIIKPLREKYAEPSNCENLSAKTVNTEIYRLMQPYDRTRDFTLKSVQANTAAAAVANLRLVDQLTRFCHQKAIHRDLCKELLKPVSDATKLLAKAYSDLSIVRKSLLSFKIAKPYQSICKKRTFGKSLFSDDLSKEIKSLDDEAKLFKTFGKPKNFPRNEHSDRSKNEYRRGRGQFRSQNRGFRPYHRGRGRGAPYQAAQNTPKSQ